MKYYKAVIILLLALVVLLLVIVGVRTQTPAAPDRNDDVAESVSPSPSPSAEPTPSPSPSASPSPSPTPTPTPTPSPTPTPTPTPTPEPAVTTTGSFSADAGAALDLIVDWTAETTGTKSAITFRVLLSSYSLYSSEAPGYITVNGTKYSFLSPDIRYDGNSRIETEIYTCTVDIPMEGGSGDVQVSAYWQFKGKYGGVTYDDLSAEHTIHIG